MDAEWISLADAARLKAVKYETLRKRLRRQGPALINDRDDHRRKLAPVTILTPEERSRWLSEKIGEAIVPAPGGPPQPVGEPLQPVLAFVPPSPSAAAREAVVAAVPAKDRRYVDGWLDFIAKNENGTWRLYRNTIYAERMIRSGDDFNRAEAHLRGVSIRNCYDKLKLARQILSDPTIQKSKKWLAIAEALVPKPRPGRSGHSYFADPREEISWQWPALRQFYLHQGQLSVKAAHELLCDLIDRKQAAWGLEHHYPRPTLGQCRTALEKISRPERVLGRQGEEAFHNKCASFIKRRPPEESGAVVGTDGKLLDILCRDAGWRIGRLWWVPFADVASERWLGHAFGPTVSGEMVLAAAAMMLEEACVPGSVQIDRGKPFQGSRFNGGFFKLSGEKVFAEMEGLWQRLGVRVVSAIGANPETKPVERLFRSVRAFEQSWSTYTGPNPQERPPQLALIEKQVQEFKAGKAPAPPVPTIEEVVAGLIWWCKERWNAQHRGRGKYRKGLTPDEMWNVKCPAGGHRRLSREEVDYYTSDRRFLKIGRGGEVAWSIYGQSLTYFSPELFLHQGEMAEVLISRLALDKVTVIFPTVGGTESCVARLKEELPWGSESRAEVKVRLRCIASVKRVLKRSVRSVDTAEGVLAQAPFLPTRALLDTLAAQQIINPRQFFGTAAPAPPPLGHAETSSTDFVGERLGLRKRQLTSEEVVEVPVETLAEEPPAATEPSLYELSPCTAEEL